MEGKGDVIGVAPRYLVRWPQGAMEERERERGGRE